MPEPVPPDTSTFRRERSISRAARCTFSGDGSHADEIVGGERPPAEPPDRQRHLRTRRRGADGDPRAVLESCVEDGAGHGVEPERSGDVDRRAVERGRVERGGVDGFEPAPALDPDVLRAVDHELGDLGVLEHGLEAGEERPQVPDPAGAVHSRPSSRSRQ